MRRGRKAVPRSLKILEEEGLAARKGAAPEAPGYLDVSARAEWRRIVPELMARGTLDKVDRAALAMYCRVFSRWQKANKDIDENGVVSSTDAGAPKLNPAVTVAAVCEANMTRLLKLFGAAPGARGEAKGSSNDETDELGDFLNERMA